MRSLGTNAGHGPRRPNRQGLPVGCPTRKRTQHGLHHFRDHPGCRCTPGRGALRPGRMARRPPRRPDPVLDRQGRTLAEVALAAVRARAESGFPRGKAFRPRFSPIRRMPLAGKGPEPRLRSNAGRNPGPPRNGPDRPRIDRRPGDQNNLFIENYAQLFAIAAPVLTLVAMNLLLALGGERGTLSCRAGGPSRRPAAPPTRCRHHRPRHRGGAANDPDFRRAAYAPHPAPPGRPAGASPGRQTFPP